MNDFDNNIPQEPEQDLNNQQDQQKDINGAQAQDQPDAQNSNGNDRQSQTAADSENSFTDSASAQTEQEPVYTHKPDDASYSQTQYENPYTQNSYYTQSPYSSAGNQNSSGVWQEQYSANNNQNFTNNPFTDTQNNTAAKKTHAGTIAMIIVVIVLVFAASAFAVLYFTSSSNSASDGTAAAQNTASGPSLSLNQKPATANTSSANEDGTYSVTQIAQKVRPSVVGIVGYTTSQGIANIGTPSSEGSGVIMSADGYIITNAHVIENMDKVIVVLDNDDEYAAKVIGSDSKTDIAVLKIDAKNLTVAEFGDSSEVEIGEEVVAIGNPTGLQLAGSITKGIVSATNREIQNSSTSYTMNCIQTDAAINPGNSGGALVNMYGQVIGINSSKIANVDYEGIGFAISSNDVKPVVDDIIKYGHVTGRVKMGITYTVVSDAMAAYYNLPAGIYVNSVDQNYDAYKQGVSAGDIITKIDGKEITGSEMLTEYLQGKKPGDKVKLTIYRVSATGNSGKTLEITMTLGEDDGSGSTAAQDNSQNGNQDNYGGYDYGYGQGDFSSLF